MNPSPTKQLRLGVAGIGHMGRYHVNILSQMPEVSSLCIYDVNQENLQKIATEFKTDVCATYDELLDCVDALVIAVPTHLHYEFAMKALAKGRHILVEKPVAQDVQQTKEMTESAQKNNLILHVGHVERFNGAIQEIRNLLDNPYYFQCQRIGNVSRILDVGVVLDLMIHDIDLVISLANSKVKSFSAIGQRIFTQHEDYALATLYFENGIAANLTASRVSTRKARTMAVAQKESYLHLDYASQDLMIYRNPDSKYEVSQGTIKYSEESLVDRVFIHKENPLRLELEHFLNAIRNQKPSNSGFTAWDASSNVYTMEIATEILKDIRNRSGF
ncbi:MAG: Gfo/Idh/MocA family oxidoreductase [Brevinema sp.]